MGIRNYEAASQQPRLEPINHDEGQFSMSTVELTHDATEFSRSIAALDCLDEAEASLEAIVSDLISVGVEGYTPEIAAATEAKLAAFREEYGIPKEYISIENYRPGSSLSKHYTASLEEISGFWNREKQMHVDAFKTITHFFGVVIGSVEKKSHDGLEKLSKYRTEWRRKQGRLDNQIIKTSFAGESIGACFTCNGGQVDNPLQALLEDVQITEYIFGKYADYTYKWANDVVSVLEHADLSSDATWQSSVIDRLKKLKPPTAIWDKKHLTKGYGKLYNTKVSLEPYTKGGHVVEEIWGEVAVVDYKSNYNMYPVPHDIKVPVGDVPKLFDVIERYFNAYVNFAERKGRYEVVLKRATKLLDTIKPSGEVSKSVRSDIKELRQMSKVLKAQLHQPFFSEMMRLNQVAFPAMWFTARVVAIAE